MYIFDDQMVLFTSIWSDLTSESIEYELCIPHLVLKRGQHELLALHLDAELLVLLEHPGLVHAELAELLLLDLVEALVVLRGVHRHELVQRHLLLPLGIRGRRGRGRGHGLLDGNSKA